ncbi:uncharacterized protein LOC132583378 [Heteronotia binoei]|uniref:uncharacterized protein LOC132583378 n=1 Tax=Heteronotia binoei TaxID=13085 RepID=UPI00292DAF16|nr:uncharacterized protein LOC132583378 [Heteronotia binoei]
MAGGKGSGKSKGKKPAPRPSKAPARRPPPPSSSDDEDEAVVNYNILSRLQALEQASGVPSLSGGGDVRQSKKARQANILTRLSILEGRSGGVVPGMDASSFGPDAGLVEAAGTSGIGLPVTPAGLGDAAVPGQRSRSRVLICGHSYVFWAALQARRTAVGSQLGLSQHAVIEWQGRRGLQWPGLLPLLFKGRAGPPPQVLMVHLGGNDLGLLKGKALVWQARDDFQCIRERWPETIIVWSAMLPRQVWRYALDPAAIERARYKANKEIKKLLERGLGFSAIAEAPSDAVQSSRRFRKGWERVCTLLVFEGCVGREAGDRRVDRRS